MKYNAPKYMHDVLPVAPPTEGWLHSARWRAVENVFREVCRQFGYSEIRTPVMESTELFTRSIGEGTDIVSKEMFTFEDRGGRSMTLRPEGTAPVIRSLIQNGLAGDGGVHKVYYITTIYRYERGQKGRYREHQQTGIEVIGTQDPAVDAEVLALALEYYRRLGISDCELKINTVGCPNCRPGYRAKVLAYAEPLLDQMSEDNRTRFAVNPLRMLDSKDPRDRQALADAPKYVDNVCDGCREHFDALRGYLDGLGLPYGLDPNLVRGFDYYTKTAFEIVSPSLGAQNSIGGGGRYDGLIEELGGSPTPGIGFGIGTERCLLVLEELGRALAVEDERPDVFVVTMGAGVKPQAVRVLHELRQAGVAAEMDYQGRSVKAQMRSATRLDARMAAILGEDEVARGVVGLRLLRDGSGQTEVALVDLVSAVRGATRTVSEGG